MPKYDYRCNKCGKEYTIKATLSEKREPVCPYCNSVEAQRIYGIIGIQLKGGDWGKDSY
jgi:putative FmdB family regulatory protein